MNTNKNIAKSFQLLASLMELHEMNSFKIKSYANAYLSLRKVDNNFASMDQAELSSLPGIGKSIIEKINEMVSTGKMAELEDLKAITPPGVIEILNVKGLGPKKVGVIWKELKLESIGELLLACQENRLVKAKGFGLKTQEDIIKKLQYHIDSSGKYLYANIEELAFEALDLLKTNFPDKASSLCGEIRRKMPEVKGIELITTATESSVNNLFPIDAEAEQNSLFYKGVPLFIRFSKKENFGNELFMNSASNEFLHAVTNLGTIPSLQDENQVFTHFNAEFISTEFRESADTWQLSCNHALPNLIKAEDIIGMVHCHTQYSDGIHTLEQMAMETMNLGFKYMVVTDHSRSAFYAGGLSIERVEMQWREIENLNKKFGEFKIYKGIESDILGDGSLDYPDEILSGFDVVIASVHSNLNMDIDKATNRLISAIENPYTTILGHPTGRLLLSRSGYPLHYQKIIDACAVNKVAIELNANPQRLDIDYTLLKECMEKNVKISINPDAHSTSQIKYVKYGLIAARKGGLIKEFCWNATLPPLKK